MLLSSCTFIDFFFVDDGKTPTSISLNSKSLNLDIGDTYQLTATVLPSTAENKEVTWSVGASSIATVSSEGLVTAVAKGKTIVTVTSVGNKTIFNTCEVKVDMGDEDVPVSSVTLNHSSLTMTVGDSESLVATVLPSDATNKKVNWSTSDETGLTVSNLGVLNAIRAGTYTITATSDSNSTKSASCTVTVNENESGITQAYSTHNYKEFIDHNFYSLSASPSTGYSKLLVIPVWFTDSNTYITKRDVVKQDIENAYFGNSESTGWESVQSYYQKDSFGKLEIDGIVTDWYECGKASTEFYTDYTYKTNDLVKAAGEWYKKTYSVSNYSEFDQDKDGYVDGIMLIYAAPDYRSMSKSQETAGNLWAYCFWIQEGKGTAAYPKLNAYFWASYDFMYSPGLATRNRVGSEYGAGDQGNCVIDSHTYIHEMGHVFGLEDYYDYENIHSPAGGFSMQDWNVGGHDPYSRFALGWISAYVPTKTSTITVGSVEENGKIIILPATDSFSGSAFDEYIILELFTPTRLNKMDCTKTYTGYKGPNDYGVRLWHVDARLIQIQNVHGQFGNLTTNPLSGNYGVIHATNNTTYTTSENNRAINYAGSYEYNMNHLIRNDVNAEYGGAATEILTSAMLFKTGDTFTVSKYSSQFTNYNRMNNNSTFGWSVRFDSVSSTEMTVTCTKL